MRLVEEHARLSTCSTLQELDAQHHWPEHLEIKNVCFAGGGDIAPPARIVRPLLQQLSLPPQPAKCTKLILRPPL